MQPSAKSAVSLYVAIAAISAMVFAIDTITPVLATFDSVHVGFSSAAYPQLFSNS